ncbi:MAG TPA: hypothetical protein VH143_32740 [Kofleriaceae bacterium]|nr:hypothetical protein [Kofleriaceae bacterium]
MTTNDTQALVRGEAHDELIRPTPILALKERRAHIVEVMRELLIEGHHFGRIPNTGDKQVLLLAGAQMLAASVGLGPQYEIERIDLANTHREYQVLCTLNNIATGVAVGQGVGSCSTMESRYRWRKGERSCPECGAAAIIKGKSDYGGGWLCFSKKGGCGTKWPDGAAEIESQLVGRVENSDIADTFNTVLKMAKKRAFVDAVLTTLGASDLFTQDLEDLVTEVDRETPAEPEPTGKSQQRTERRSAPVSQSKQQEVGPDWIVDLVGAIDDTTSVDELKPIAAKINALPKGSAARRTGKAAFEQQMAKLQAAAASGSAP